MTVIQAASQTRQSLAYPVYVVSGGRQLALTMNDAKLIQHAR